MLNCGRDLCGIKDSSSCSVLFFGPRVPCLPFLLCFLACWLTATIMEIYGFFLLLLLDVLVLAVPAGLEMICGLIKVGYLGGFGGNIEIECKIFKLQLKIIFSFSQNYRESPKILKHLAHHPPSPPNSPQLNANERFLTVHSQ